MKINRKDFCRIVSLVYLLVLDVLDKERAVTFGEIVKILYHSIKNEGLLDTVFAEKDQ